MRILPKIAVLAALGCLLKMTYLGELGLLIHPRYFWLIYLSILVLCLTLFFAPLGHSKKARFSTITLTIFFILGIFIEIKPLSSNAQQQVTTYTNSQNENNRSRYLTNFKVDTSSLSLEDLLSLVSIDPEPSKYEGKEVNLTGFYFENSNGTPMVAKYVLSCCAADARIVGIWLTEDLEIETDTWISLSGTLEEVTFGSIRSVAVNIQDFSIIETPKSPYVTN